MSNPSEKTTISEVKKNMIDESSKVTLEEAIKQYDMEKHIFSLLNKEPFFAAMSRHVDKKPSLQIPTAGVRITSEGYYEMIYNPLFFAKYDAAKRLGVLKHEFYHLVLEHVTERLPDEGMTKLWNIATDLSINSHIADELPEIACIPGRGPFADMPANMTAEWYYQKLIDKSEGQNGNDYDSSDSLDDHSGWDENTENIDPSIKEIAKQRLKEIMKEAADEANKRSWGSVSSSMRGEILDRISSKVDWRSVLRYFIKTSKRSSKTKTVRRLNKRYPYIHAGVKVKRHANIASSIDQSGSVNDEMLSLFFAELNSLSKVATFTVVPFDSTVDEKLIYTWKKGVHKKAERVMCGGTDFDAPTKYVNENDFDGHIILTDMYAEKPGPSKCQRMWMTTKDCANNPYFSTNERVIVVE